MQISFFFLTNNNKNLERKLDLFSFQSLQVFGNEWKSQRMLNRVYYYFVVGKEP